MKPTHIDKKKLEASICQDSFYEFLKRFWDSVVSSKFKDNWHIKFLCDELQKMAERVFENKPKLHDLLINISPGTTKSTICSVMFPAWLWTKRPDMRTICTSHSYYLAMDLSRRSRDVVMSEKWTKLFGNVDMRADQNSKGMWMNTKGGFRLCMGTGGVTGLHGHFIIVDDPLTPEEAASDVERTNANLWISETLLTRKVDKEVNPVIMIMQRLHQDDPSNLLMERANNPEGTPVRHIRLPAEVDDASKKEVKPRILLKNYQNGLMDPLRLSRTTLNRMRVDLGEYAYAGQFLQRPIPRAGGTVHVDKILISTPPLYNKFKSLVRYWDKAATLDAGCYTVGLLMGIDRDEVIWVLDVIRGQWDAFTRERIIRQTAEMDGRNIRIGIEEEGGSGGKESSLRTVKLLHGFNVFRDRPTGDKAMRILPFAAQVNGDNVRMKSGPWNQPYIEEMRYFPDSKYKDQGDASSGAYNGLVGRKIRVGGMKAHVKENVA